MSDSQHLKPSSLRYSDLTLRRVVMDVPKTKKTGFESYFHEEQEKRKAREDALAQAFMSNGYWVDTPEALGGLLDIAEEFDIEFDDLVRVWRRFPNGCTIRSSPPPISQFHVKYTNWKACIDLLRKARCTWKETNTRDAAKHKNFDLLKLLVSQGCPWHKETLDFAEQSGNRDMIEYAHAHERKPRQRANVAKLFEALEKNKHQMTTQEYIEVAKAAQELHNGI